MSRFPARLPRFLSTASALLALSGVMLPVGAEPLRADRPSLSTGPLTLPAGILQLEIGTGFATGDRPAVQSELSQRFGLVPGLEFRMRAPLEVSGLEATSRLSLGAKAQFLEGYLLSLGALGSLELSPDANPSTQASMLATLGLPRGFALTLNAGPVLAPSGLDWSGAALLSYDPGDLWQVFGEIARLREAGAARWGADVGLSVLVSDDVSWDLSLFKGLTGGGTDWAVSSGFALRWGVR